MLKKLSLTVSGPILLSLLLALQGWSQQQIPAPTSGIPAAPKAARHYDPQAVETLAGNVIAINRKPAKRSGRPDRVTMVFKTDKGTFKVHLGPADYLDRQTLKLASGDRVEVKGIRVSRPKGSAFIAGEVRKGDQVLKLRDDTTGRPLWAKGRKNPT